MDKNNYDCSGWATVNDVLCADGRTIRRDAFKANNGQVVPVVWNHKHGEVSNVLGHALLENRPEGVYTYVSFNDTVGGRTAKQLVEHGDIRAFSIFANSLKQNGNDVIHGNIREVSLVLAGANPKAYIDNVIAHGQESEEEAYILTAIDTEIVCHAEELKESSESKKTESDTKKDETEGSKDEDNAEQDPQELFDSLTDDQKTLVYALVGAALESEDPDAEDNTDNSEGGKEEMKHNLFEEGAEVVQDNFIAHSDQMAILANAKNKAVGTFRNALEDYVASKSMSDDGEQLAHGIDSIDTLFPDFKDIKPGAPDIISRDQTWIAAVMQKVGKTPFSRIRTRQADIRDKQIRGRGYTKTKQKKDMANIKLLKRTTDPQTVYVKDKLDRDDIVDIVDFDVVEYLYGIMRMNLNEELAMAIMVGDGREEGDEDKIDETHIRPIWKDDDLYTIHTDVDIAGMKKSLQGTNTSANFGDNYVYAEAIIQSALYAREQYKGSGSLDFYCAPHVLNMMLLARDLNGRRIYNSVSDLATALNVNSIQTAEQFDGLVREAAGSKKKKLLGLFVNLADYNVGATKGGEITRFNQFDIDFNQEKYLIETRVSGALTRPYSAIALEEDVTESF